MSRKLLQIHVDVHIQAVTCPGAWLCPRGNVSLHLYMLDSCVQTESIEPVFPLNYQEKVVFYKCFSKIQTLTELYKRLEKLYLYAELVQLDEKGNGDVLATFQNTLNQVLFPGGEGTVIGLDVDLLMEPAPHFPVLEGIIAPKIELSSRTTLEEVMCCDHRDGGSFHKVILSNPNINCFKNRLHQKKVCHSLRYHKNINQLKPKHSKKPPFAYRKAEETLLARKPGLEIKESPSLLCTGCKRRYISPLNTKLEAANTQSAINKIQTTKSGAVKYCQPPPICTCGSVCGNCTVCTKYNCYFNPDEDQNERKVSCNRSGRSSSYQRTTTNGCANKECSCGKRLDKMCCCHRDKTSLAQCLHERVTKTLSESTDPSTCTSENCLKLWW